MKVKINDLKEFPLNQQIYGEEDNTELKKSIEKCGILNPLGITLNNFVFDGHRRLQVAKELKIDEVEVRVNKELKTDLQISQAIIESNRQRVKTGEQKAREFKELKRIETALAKERMSEGGKNKGRENFPDLEPGRSRDIAARQVGMSGKTAEKAEKIIDLIDSEEIDDDEKEDFRDTLNKSVDKAYNKAKEKGYIKKEEDNTKSKNESKFNRTNDNIEWAGWTWNPVTGCEQDCDYCYARDIAERFYKEKFKPTFHEDRLLAPSNTKPDLDEPGGKNVFVCSMADLFGSWIPNEWIFKVIEQVEKNPQWIFIFLTKNPKRYKSIQFPNNAWVGATVDIQKRVNPTEDAMEEIEANIKFVSCEPMLEPIKFNNIKIFDWIIIGARSKTNTGKEYQPNIRWVKSLWDDAENAGCKVYWKPNLLVRPKEYPIIKE